MRLLVRLEGLRTKPVCGAVVLDLVAGHAGATGWHFREPMFITAYPTETILGAADPQRATALRVLAPWFLGMVGRSGSIRISLRGCFLNTAADNVTVGIRIRLLSRLCQSPANNTGDNMIASTAESSTFGWR